MCATNPSPLFISSTQEAEQDTGLDFDACFFRDDHQEVKFYPATNPSHRKVLSYQEMVNPDGTRDHTDPYSAHGTAADLVCGPPVCVLHMYVALAPKPWLFCSVGSLWAQ